MRRFLSVAAALVAACGFLAGCHCNWLTDHHHDSAHHTYSEASAKSCPVHMAGSTCPVCKQSF